MNDTLIRPKVNESLLAAAAHIFGWLPALAVWATQKNKSRYVRFQAAQAIYFDVVTTAMTVYAFGAVFAGALALAALSIGDIALLGSQNPTAGLARGLLALLDAVPFLAGLAAALLVGIAILFRLVAAFQTLQRKDYHYPWLGNFIEAKLF